MKKATAVSDIHAAHCAPHHPKRICWTAIIVGALVGLGLSFLLNLFGVAIGLSAISVGDNGGLSIALGGLLGFAIAIIATMATAGYTAGYLGRFYCPQRNLGILYGFTTWSVALVLSAALMGTVSNYSHTVANSKLVVKEDTAQHTMRQHVETDKSTTQVEASSTHLAQGAFALFALFFVSAFSACVGACYGMSCTRED
jgi:hypothetical protein